MGSQLSEKPPLSILCSYAFMVNSPKMVERLSAFEQRHQGKLQLLVDSGAFTAWRIGREITLSGYCSFLASLPVTPWRYITLDVIENPEKTRENLAAMRHAGFAPVPVFTPGESFDSINALYETTDMIACGGVAGKYSRYGLAYLNRVMREVNARQIHLLGVTNMGVLKHFKPYSADSSSWEVSRRYGRVSLYSGYGRMRVLERDDFLSAPSHEVIAEVSRLGLDVTRLTDDKHWRGLLSTTSRITAASWVRLQRDAYQHLGTRIFLAAVDPHAIDLLTDAWEAVA